MKRHPKHGRANGRPFVDPRRMPPDDSDHPVFKYDHRLREIERAFYPHLLRVIDLDALASLEWQLLSLLQDPDPLDDQPLGDQAFEPQPPPDLRVLDLANAIIERALARVGRDPIRTMRPGVLGDDGKVTPIPVPEAPHVQCPFCDDDDDGGGGSGPVAASGPDESNPADEGTGPFYDNSGPRDMRRSH